MLAAALGGLDAFVFTAGVGENSAAIRARIAERLAWLGAELDPAANDAGATPHLDARQPRRALCHSDRRGADDRAPYAGARRRQSNADPSESAGMPLPVVKAKLLEGRKGLIVGIANDRSIAWGCARAFRAFGAELAVTYLNDKAKPHVEPLAREVEAPIFMPLDMSVHRVSSRRCSSASRRPGASSTSWSTRSPFRRKRHARRARRRRAARGLSRRPWTSPAGPSSAWRISPSR